MSAIKLRCKLQDNGFRQAEGRELTLAECRELFGCDEAGINCTHNGPDGPYNRIRMCTVLELGIRR